MLKTHAKLFSFSIIFFALTLGLSGCGSIKKPLATPEPLDLPNNPNIEPVSAPKRYVIYDKNQCEEARFTCGKNESAFFDEKGCGCTLGEGEVTSAADSDETCALGNSPVCGEVEIQCIKAPCLPIKETFANRCDAEKLNVLNITDGPCVDTATTTITTPLKNSVIKSPLTISGQATGNWFFEGALPAQVEDANGQVLGDGRLQAEGEWMTPQAVKFSGTISFKKSTTLTGFIVLRNDNPSGLPENAREFKWPVRF